MTVSTFGRKRMIKREVPKREYFQTLEAAIIAAKEVSKERGGINITIYSSPYRVMSAKFRLAPSAHGHWRGEKFEWIGSSNDG